MPKKMSAQKVKEKVSWWDTLPGIITKITALIVAVTGLIGAVVGVTSLMKGSNVFHPSAPCADFGQGLQWGLIRVGVEDAPVFEIASPVSLDKARILTITENGKVNVGSIEFKYYLPPQDEFEIIAVVDKDCRSKLDSPEYKGNGEEFTVSLGKEYLVVFHYVDQKIIASVKYAE